MIVTGNTNLANLDPSDLLNAVFSAVRIEEPEE